MLITLSDIIAKGGPGENSLQLLINRFAPLYDNNLETYIQLQLLRLVSGAVGSGGATVR